MTAIRSELKLGGQLSLGHAKARRMALRTSGEVATSHFRGKAWGYTLSMTVGNRGYGTSKGAQTLHYGYTYGQFGGMSPSSFVWFGVSGCQLTHCYSTSDNQDKLNIVLDLKGASADASLSIDLGGRMVTVSRISSSGTVHTYQGTSTGVYSYIVGKTSMAVRVMPV